MEPLVIVGTGLAGYTLARAFRKIDAATPLYLVTGDGQAKILDFGLAKFVTAPWETDATLTSVPTGAIV